MHCIRVNAVSSPNRAFPFLIYSLFMESVVTLVRYVCKPPHHALSIAEHSIDVYYGNWKMKEMKAREKFR